MTVSYADLGLHAAEPPERETARQWFEKLPEKEQRGFFSNAAWKEFQAGNVTLDDFIGIQKSKVWGDAYVEKSLAEILGS